MGIMTPGQTMTLPPGRAWTLRTGRAGVLDVKVGDKPVPALGGPFGQHQGHLIIGLQRLQQVQRDQAYSMARRMKALSTWPFLRTISPRVD